MQITADGIAITTEGIITLASLILALVSIFTLIFKVYRWYLKQEKQDEKIRSIEEENTLLCFGISVSMHDTGIVADALIEQEIVTDPQALSRLDALRQLEEPNFDTGFEPPVSDIELDGLDLER